ncbi:hypothetical protein ACEZCY_18860 [Streptacidiphilus sp. N1-12]|uniref:Uncharacterized protein n=2 Tax=Streptacidiphilus alkalitolerans TaxID=3342712 RepID=A0ABV6WGZ3_9ACTN
MQLVDTVTGSVAALTCGEKGWQVRESGPLRLWGAVETVLDDYDGAGCPPPETFRLGIDLTGQYLRHPRMSELSLAKGDSEAQKSIN